jgi:hypothetical protein
MCAESIQAAKHKNQGSSSNIEMQARIQQLLTKPRCMMVIELINHNRVDTLNSDIPDSVYICITIIYFYNDQALYYNLSH